ncbi:MAG: efflux RND transporter periplasmic adaptor subunit [Deltaproteobacteria bacterium]|nr:efflux RND transporter periplasmic adaptor subunit [Deltaproteobacteria bacterium]
MNLNRLFLSLFTSCFLASNLLAQVNVIAYKVNEESLNDQIESLGTLRANEVVDLTASVTDTITKIHFNDGQRVNKGDVLAEMTDSEEGALVKENTARVEEAKRQYDRVKNLPDQGAISESLVDQRRREYEAAKAQLEAMISRLHDRLIVAPFSGVMGLRQISVGALVTPGDKIGVLVDDSTMKLDFSVPEVYLGALKPGLPIVGTTPAFPDQKFEGELVAVDAQIDPRTRSIIVRAILPNDKLLLKPGLLMKVKLGFNFRKSLIVPEEALLPAASDNYVYKISGENALKTKVEIGTRQPGKVEILKGLSVGDLIVTHGHLALDQDTKVTVKKVLELGQDLSEALAG